MPDLIGKTLGAYRVIEQIGVGGMATVYKAYQPSMDRYVAVKVLPHYLAQDRDFVKRFQREARAIAKLEHAHILPVHDYGEADGVTYLAMRYVDAGTLKQHLAKGPLPFEEISRIVGQIGGALDYAHRLGVIHRDVKPGNVLIDDQGNTYLTDFGLARMLETSQQLTASGVGVGTPAYMSPEQGQGVKVDHRSDIYSLGVILFEMVTGHVPYEAETPMAVMLKHINEPLPLPRVVNPDVPEPIERVILKALAKDLAHRYQTAGEMAQALAAATRKVNHAPPKPIAPPTTPARRPDDISLMTRVQHMWNRPSGKIVLIGLAAVLLIALGAVLSQLPGTVQIVGPGENATATSAIAQAATPITTRPTATPAASTAEQARVFADPVLAAIANRSPDYQNDFSDPGSGWDIVSYVEGQRSGAAGYKDGEYFLIADPASAQHPDVHSWLEVPGLEVSDFVMEFDARLISAGHGSIYVHFRVQEKNVYAADVAPDGRVRLATQTIQGDTPLAETQGRPLKLNEVNRVRIIAKGSRIALYLNDRTVLMADQEFTDRGDIILGIWNGVGTPMQVNFDNFKVWDISQLSATTAQGTPTPAQVAPTPTATLSPQAEQARAFAKPILQAIADRPPDFEDDFSTNDKGWTADFSCGQISNGHLRTSILTDQPAQSDGRYTCGAHNPDVLNVTDFVFEIDLTQTQAEVQGSAGVQWRHTDGYYRVAVDAPGKRWALLKSSTSLPSDVGLETLQEWEGPASGRIRVIGRGSQFAVYIDETPVFYLKDELNPSGEIDLWLNASDGPVTVEYDNVRLWNLDNAPELQTAEAQARAFAEPILAAIADRQPDFEDDFSNLKSGWLWQGTDSKGQTVFAPDGIPASAFSDGTLTLTTPDDVYGNAWTRACDNFNAFVVQTDLTLVDLASSAGGTMEIIWRIGQNAGHYTFGLGLDLSSWQIVRFGPNKNEAATLLSGSAKVNGPKIPNRILVVGLGSRFAVYLNDAPLAYFEDAFLPRGNGVCNFVFGAPPGSVTVSIDNIKAWNLDNAPGLP